MSWWTGRALGLDFESDRPVPTEARIITGATVGIAPTQEPITNEIMLCPERDIPQEAADIHGITTERATAEGLPREGGLAMIAMSLAGAAPDVPVVGHNVSYDLTLFDRELRRTSLGSLGERDGMVTLRMDGRELNSFYVIDTYVMDKGLDKYRPGKRRLEFAAEQYGVPMAEGSAHGAAADVLASLRIAYVMAARCSWAWGLGPAGYDQARVRKFEALYEGRKQVHAIRGAFSGVHRLDLPQLHMVQKRWAREQAESLREHFITSGTGDPAEVDGSWPLRPLGRDETVETISTTLV